MRTSVLLALLLVCVAVSASPLDREERGWFKDKWEQLKNVFSGLKDKLFNKGKEAFKQKVEELKALLKDGDTLDKCKTACENNAPKLFGTGVGEAVDDACEPLCKGVLLKSGMIIDG